MITVLYPCDISNVVLTSSWKDHVNRPGYNRAYAGTDLAGREQPLRPSQYRGKVLQAMWSTQGYGYTTFMEHGGILRIRTAHQKNLSTNIGDVVNPDDTLGIMDSTGNSTGTHVHWEVWLKRNNVWQNIDPYDPSNGIKMVNDPAQLIPLDDEEVVVPPGPVTPPTFPKLLKVTTTSLISSYINLRAQPKTASVDLGDFRAGEVWECFAAHTDVLGNIWYGVKKDVRVGWVAGYYQGERWLKEVAE